MILFMPAYIANPGAVITGGHFRIDMGKSFNNKRILGDGKTWSGLIGGTLIGMLSGLIIFYILELVHSSYGNYSSNLLGALYVLFIMSFGSLFGDIAGSFIKRRLGMKRGARGSILDQWPFVIMSFIFLLFFARAFFIKFYGDTIPIIVLLIITPPVHRGVNVLAHKLKMKDVPW